MAGPPVAGGIKPVENARAKLVFQRATPRDDADIRRLLRENPLGGAIQWTAEREPSLGLAGSGPEQAACPEVAVLARRQGRAVCVGTCTVQNRFVNGRPMPVGYLGALRLDRSVSGRFDIVRRGYRYFWELAASGCWPARPEYFLTSIVTDNVRARRFLERRLPGMPDYEYVGGLASLIQPVPVKARPASDGNSDYAVESICSEADWQHWRAWWHRRAGQYQWAPTWTSQEITRWPAWNLARSDFVVVKRRGKWVAGAALWDQRGYKQTVIHGYTPWLARCRPWWNLVAPLLSQPRLPAPGETLAHGMIAFLTTEPDADPRALKVLHRSMERLAIGRGLNYTVLGLAESDPRARVWRRLARTRIYRSRLYLVHASSAARGDSIGIDGRIAYPEVALL